MSLCYALACLPVWWKERETDKCVGIQWLAPPIGEVKTIDQAVAVCRCASFRCSGVQRFKTIRYISDWGTNVSGTVNEQLVINTVTESLEGMDTNVRSRFKTLRADVGKGQVAVASIANFARVPVSAL